jgi:hypothetical protein
MKKAWKGLAALAVASALVVAPLVTAGASAHTGDLDVSYQCDTSTGEYVGTATLTISQTGLAGSSKWRVGTTSFQGTPNSDSGMDRGPVASSGAGTITLGTFRIPGDTTTKGPWVYAHTTWTDGFKKGSDGQSYENLGGDCQPDDIVVTPPTPTFTDPCGLDNASWSGPEFEGGTWGYGSDDEGNLYIEAIPADGYAFPEGAQTEWVDKDSGELCPVEIVPPTVDVAVDCLSEGENNVFSTATNPNDVTVNVTLALELDGDGDFNDFVEVLPVAPGESSKGYSFDEDTTLGVRVLFGESVIFQEILVVDCEPNTEVYPVPAFFNAPDPAPTCASAAEFITPGELVSEGEVIHEDEEAGLIVYRFENVDVAIYRDVPGEVYIEVYAHEGYVLEDLDESLWDVSEDGDFASRTIELAGAIGYQNEDPAQPCFFSIVSQPAPPTFTDPCGTSGDDFSVPTGTDEFAYEVVEEGDTVTVTAYLLNEDNEWAEGVVTEWSHTFTNVACPTGTTPPPTAPALAATGAPDMTLWGGAGFLALLAGAALMTIRRVVRH